MTFYCYSFRFYAASMSWCVLLKLWEWKCEPMHSCVCSCSADIFTTHSHKLLCILTVFIGIFCGSHWSSQLLMRWKWLMRNSKQKNKVTLSKPFLFNTILISSFSPLWTTYRNTWLPFFTVFLTVRGESFQHTGCRDWNWISSYVCHFLHQWMEISMNTLSKVPMNKRFPLKTVFPSLCQAFNCYTL